VESITNTVDDIRKDQKDQNTKLDKLLALHHQRKGYSAALKVFATMGGSSGFAALVAHLWDKFHP